MTAERELKLKLLQMQASDTADSLTQKAVGGAIGKYAPDGKVTAENKPRIVIDAAATLATNGADSFGVLGVDNVPKKSKEMVERTLGLMAAEAAGQPVPNPSVVAPKPSTSQKSRDYIPLKN